MSELPTSIGPAADPVRDLTDIGTARQHVQADAADEGMTVDILGGQDVDLRSTVEQRGFPCRAQGQAQLPTGVGTAIRRTEHPAPVELVMRVDGLPLGKLQQQRLAQRAY